VSQKHNVTLKFSSFRRSIHTAQVFHLQKSTFINRTSSFPESSFSNGDWPVRNTWRYWPTGVW